MQNLGSKTVLLLASYSRSIIDFRGPLINELLARGHFVIAAAPEDEYFEDVSLTLHQNGVELHRVPLDRAGISPVADMLTYRALIKLIRRLKPDVLLGYTIKPVIYGGLASQKVGDIKFFPMITGLGYAFTEARGLKRKLVRFAVERLYRRALGSANAVIFQNPDDQALFQSLNLLPKNTVVRCVRGSGVDLSSFPSTPLPNALVFLMLARLVSDKGVREYVAAARKVRKQFPHAVFRLAGAFDGNPTSIKMTEVKKWVEEGVIEYLGDLTSVQEALATCRVYVLPSYREGTPRSVLEAMATGRPVITSDAPGCRETVIHGENGLLVKPRDADALALAMIELIEMDKADVNRMADASLAMARDKYDVDKVNAEILRVMRL